MLYSLIQNMLHIDIFWSSCCNMKEHHFCFLFHMIQVMSSAFSLNIHFCPNRNSLFQLSYLACCQQCPGHCSIRNLGWFFVSTSLANFLVMWFQCSCCTNVNNLSNARGIYPNADSNRGKNNTNHTVTRFACWLQSLASAVSFAQFWGHETGQINRQFSGIFSAFKGK